VSSDKRNFFSELFSELLIAAFVICLILAAAYFTGNWNSLMRLLREAYDFIVQWIHAVKSFFTTGEVPEIRL